MHSIPSRHRTPVLGKQMAPNYTFDRCVQVYADILSDWPRRTATRSYPPPIPNESRPHNRTLGPRSKGNVDRENLGHFSLPPLWPPLIVPFGPFCRSLGAMTGGGGGKLASRTKLASPLVLAMLAFTGLGLPPFPPKLALCNTVILPPREVALSLLPSLLQPSAREGVDTISPSYAIKSWSPKIVHQSHKPAQKKFISALGLITLSSWVANDWSFPSLRILHIFPWLIFVHPSSGHPCPHSSKLRDGVAFCIPPQGEVGPSSEAGSIFFTA